MPMDNIYNLCLFLATNHNHYTANNNTAYNNNDNGK